MTQDVQDAQESLSRETARGRETTFLLVDDFESVLTLSAYKATNWNRGIATLLEDLGTSILE